MPLSRDEFTQQLTASGLLDAASVAESLSSLPPDKQPADGEALARELVRQKKLTKFQAEQLYAGKGKSLTLGNYVILDKLGQGGMGMVLKAEHKRMKRLVALKVMSPAAVKSADALKRFHREVEAAAKLSHPNIVAAHDADEAKGTHFLVMEYVEGTDLSVLVKKHGPLPADQAVRCIIQAARGLEFAHEQGVIHRDIKPANLLIDAKGTVKILDMGLARIDDSVGGSSEGAGLTSTGTIMGTVDYMSPEQAMDTKHADARSDIYSLGCSLYYLLTGKVLYDGDTIMKKLMAHREATIPDLCSPVALRQESRTSLDIGSSSASSGVDGSSAFVSRSDTATLTALDAVFRRMVAKRPEDRPQSMSEVIAELERCLSGGSPTVAFERSVSSNTNATASGTSSSGNELQDFLRQISGGEPATVTSTRASERPETPYSAEAETMISSADGAGTDPRTEQSLTMERMRELRSPPSGKKTATRLVIGVLSVLFLGLLIVVATRGRSKSPSKSVASKNGKAANSSGQRDQDNVVSNKSGTTSKAAKTKATAGYFALQFDGESAHVEVPTLRLDGLSELTIEARVRPAIRPGRKGSILAGLSDPLFAVDVNEEGRLSGYLMRGRQPGAVFSPSFVDGSWHDVTVTVSGTKVELFIDGMPQPVDKPPYEVVPDGVNIPRDRFLIGAGQAWDVRAIIYPFQGEIDELRVSRTIRHRGEYAPTERLTADKETLALYHFDEGNGSELKDSSGNKHHGKIVGAKWVKVDRVVKPIVRAFQWPKDAPPPAKAPFDAAQARAHQEAWAKHLGIEVETTNSVGTNLVLIPPGEFLMGSSAEQIAQTVGELELAHGEAVAQQMKDNKTKSETPQHRVVISRPFLISTTEVTVAQFKKFVAETGYVTYAEHPTWEGNSTYLKPGFAPADEYPVTCVMSIDAAAYCGWLSDVEGTLYRLPTEAEWEMACRAGTVSRYSWGDDITQLAKFAWTYSNSGAHPHPGAQKRPNAYGLFDMHGNAAEWCRDQFEETWYARSPLVDPIQTSLTGAWPVRGGSWNANGDISIAYRVGSHHFGNIGFRVVRVLEPLSAAPVQPLAASHKLFLHDPEFPKWMKEVQAMPAAKQAEAVQRELREHNPMFDGPAKPNIENGIVTELTFLSDHVTDLSPLKSLAGLTRLTCTGSVPDKSKLSDLMPLKGMPLKSLICDNTEVADLSPLHDCKSLKKLTCRATQVTAEQVAALQKAIPDCVIEWDDFANADVALQNVPAGQAPPRAKAPFNTQQARAQQETWAKHLTTEVETTNSVGAKMVLIPPGEFRMGSTEAQIALAVREADEGWIQHIDSAALAGQMRRSETPQHRVVITKPFFIGATEVTIGQFKKFVAETQYRTTAEKKAQNETEPTYLRLPYPLTDDHPVSVLSRDDIKAYCDWLSAREKAVYRLPSEAEWEYACRAGTTTRYSWGDGVSFSPKYAWTIPSSSGHPNPVAMKLPNPFGLFDMHGNVAEWCGDLFDETWYEKSPITNPYQPPPPDFPCSARGGHFLHGSTFSSTVRAVAGDIHLFGFRVVRELDGPPATTASLWTDWLGPKLKEGDFKDNRDGWVVEGDAITTDRAIQGIGLLPADTRDAAMRLTYLLRDSKGVQLAAREHRIGEKRQFVYFAEDNGEKIQIAMYDHAGTYKALAEKAVPASISKDAPRTLEFRLVGNTLTLMLNGSVVLTAEDHSRSDGLFHFAALKGVLIQKIELQRLDGPAVGAPKP